MVKVEKPALIIDGSAFAFIHANKVNYKESILGHLERLMDIFKTDRYIIILENSSSNFRRKVAVTKEYKGQREKYRDKTAEYLPYLYECFTFIRENLNPVTYYGIENDDAISIIGNKMRNCIICGDDVDLLSIPGKHYKLKKNIVIDVKDCGTIEIVNDKVLATGVYNTYFKIIKGSAKENYSGVSGYGEKKVYALFKQIENDLKDVSKRKKKDLLINRLQCLCMDLFYNTFGVKDGKDKLEEGFRLCYLLEDNNNFIFPKINIYDRNEIRSKIKSGEQQ